MSDKPYICFTCKKTYRNEKSFKSHTVHCQTQNDIIKEMREQLSELKLIVASLQGIQSQQHSYCKRPAKTFRPLNAFSHENYSHMISPISTCFIVEQIKNVDTGNYTGLFRETIKMLYKDSLHKENNTVQFKDDYFALYNGSQWKRVDNKHLVVKKIRQRVNSILQHFITTDTEEFIKAVGEDRLKDLDRFTYKVDTCDEDPKFEDELNIIVFDAIIDDEN